MNINSFLDSGQSLPENWKGWQNIFLKCNNHNINGIKYFFSLHVKAPETSWYFSKLRIFGGKLVSKYYTLQETRVRDKFSKIFYPSIKWFFKQREIWNNSFFLIGCFHKKHMVHNCFRKILLKYLKLKQRCQQNCKCQTLGLHFGSSNECYLDSNPWM